MLREFKKKEKEEHKIKDEEQDSNQHPLDS